MSEIEMNIVRKNIETKAGKAHYINRSVNGVKFLEIEPPESRLETVKRHNQE